MFSELECKINHKKEVFLIGKLVECVKKNIGEQKFEGNNGPLRMKESKAENVW